jgi:DNA polymerase I-like protein with 3'-5' exonuclease and polymerase domains
MLPRFLQELDPSIYLGDNYVVLDFEVDTSHGDHGNPVHADNALLLGCWKTGKDHPDGASRRCAWGNEFEQAALLRSIGKADFIVAHASKYELGWLIRAGIDPRTVLVWDTKLAEYVLLGNLAVGDKEAGIPPRALDLDTVCRRRGLPVKDPVVDTMIKDQINPVLIPRPWLEGRCAQDVDTTEQVFLSQREQLRKTSRLGVAYTRNLLTPALAAMEQEGMALDPVEVPKAYEEYSEKFARLSADMSAMTGGINWRSSKQVAPYLYDVLKFEEIKDARGQPRRNKGAKTHNKDGSPVEKRKTDQKTVDALKAKTPEQKAFVKLRKELGKVSAALTKNLNFFMGVIREYGGVFYGEFNQTNTATHRLSASGIEMLFQTFLDADGKPKWMKAQFQNMDRKFKKLFKAKRVTDDGRPWLVFEPDGSQLEFRVAAFLGQDRQAMEDIANKDWDAHVTSGAAMSQRPYEELYKLYKAGDVKATEIRQQAKTETFKPLYGGEFGTPAQMRWYEEFKRRYKDIADVQKDWAAKVAQDKRLITQWGMRYYWPRAKMDGNGRVNVKTQVFNYPVQALATAEIIPVALVYFWHRLREAGMEDKAYLVNTVHDSLVVEVHPDYLEKVKEIAMKAFTTDVYQYLSKVYGIEFNVPLGIGMKAGLNWGTGAESAFNIWPDGRKEQVK